MPAIRAAAVMKRRKPRDKKLDKSKKGRKGKKKRKHSRPNIGCCRNRKHSKISYKFQAVRDAPWFQTSLIGVIFAAGILVGIQTYDIPPGAFLNTLEVLDAIILWIFILEIVIKMVAEGNRPLNFFTDGWNVFDFLIVAVGLMPFGGNAITALRLVRLLRVLKLVRALPKLRILVMGLLLSMSSIAYIGMLLMLLFYLFAVLGVSVFGLNDPVHFGSLHMAFITLFRCATLEDWTDVMYINMFGCDNYGYGNMEELCVQPTPTPIISVAFNCIFVTLSSMMILNLFIGVITSSMAEAKGNLTAEAEEMEPDPDFSQIGARMEALDAEMTTIVRELREAITERARAAADVTPDVPLSLGSLHERSSTVFQAVGAEKKSGASDTAAQRPPLPISRKLSQSSGRLVVNPHASPPQHPERLFTPSRRRPDGADRIDTSLDSKEAPRPGSATRHLFRTGSARITPTNSPRSVVGASPRAAPTMFFPGPAAGAGPGTPHGSSHGSNDGASAAAGSAGGPDSSPPGRGPVRMLEVENFDVDDSSG